ncbi:MAG: hypothetical protein HND44_05005 [Chloroflexi bacterium]|nr:hypothetical protein [Ardenticatenaceae bacterium]MBL1127853.1 hypothetical protein [Chloroflexota bacterium]NOG33922.1 hypothetical protein [Chloroflexota bacterium]GIK55606.1 MAG: hypothetical protein BroJett015_12690 [Chloroflexota bacterium]
MEKQQLLFKWLALTAVAEWLIMRTATRAAIHMPKSPAFITVYQGLNTVGQVAATFVGLLALVLLVDIAWHGRQQIWLSLSLVGLALLSVLFLVVVPPAWLALLYQLLAVTAVLLICTRVLWGQRVSGGGKRGWQGTAVGLFPALALLAGLFVQLWPNLYALLGWPGPPPLTRFLFNLGELLVVVTVFIWWWCYGRTRSWIIWLLAAIPALLFALSFWRDPAMTGILTIWSTGLTLFLPWPVYALALWLAGVTVLATCRTVPAIAYAILLLIAAGYTPQLSSQLFCAIIGLWLLARPEAVSPSPLPFPAATFVHHRQPVDQPLENKLLTDHQ